MLPGFRFLFATVVLAVSVLIFGLGAAALLRAAHEEFVSLPSWRLAQQPVLAPQFEMSGPTLAMLRVEALAAKPSADKPRQQAIIRDLPRDLPRNLPDTMPAAIAPQDNPAPQADAVTGDTARDVEQASSASVVPDEQVVALNAQASILESAAPDAAVDQAKASRSSEPQPLEIKSSAFGTAEVKAPDTRFAAAKASAPAASETKSFDAKLSDQTSSATEASEPTSSDRVAALERSSEATASATLPNTVVKKANRAGARAVARRRAAIARARAAARAVQQQQRQTNDPLGLFGATPRT